MNPHDIVIEENRGINGNDSIAANNGKQQASNKKTWNDYKDVYGIFVCPKTYYQNFWWWCLACCCCCACFCCFCCEFIFNSLLKYADCSPVCFHLEFCCLCWWDCNKAAVCVACGECTGLACFLDSCDLCCECYELGCDCADLCSALGSCCDSFGDGCVSCCEVSAVCCAACCEGCGEALKAMD